MSESPSTSDPLVASLAELTALLVAEETLETVLRRVVELACRAIGACDVASVTYMSSNEPATIASTDEIADEIDAAQYTSNSGPCLAAFHDRRIVSVPSMADGDGWREFRESAIDHGISSSLSLPMATGAVKVGALNLYGRAAHAFDTVAGEAALLFSSQAAAAIWNARTHEQARTVMRHLETALETRDVIGMAKGIIMVNERITPAAAFEILRAASQAQNVKLRDLAAEVTETGLTPASTTG